MKLFLLILFVFANITSYAQASSDEPTIEDAAKFISDIYTKYPIVYHDGRDNSAEFSSMQVKSCKLIIYCVRYTVNNSNTETNAYKEIDTLVINLSNVRIDGNKVIPLSHGSIRETWLLFQTKHPMNVYENKDWSVFKYKEQPISVNPELLSEYKLPDYPNDNVFVTNGYAARLQTAFQFLVKKCGGGKLHVDEKSKF